MYSCGIRSSQQSMLKCSIIPALLYIVHLTCWLLGRLARGHRRAGGPMALWGTCRGGQHCYHLKVLQQPVHNTLWVSTYMSQKTAATWWLPWKVQCQHLAVLWAPIVAWNGLTWMQVLNTCVHHPCVSLKYHPCVSLKYHHKIQWCSWLIEFNCSMYTLV